MWGDTNPNSMDICRSLAIGGYTDWRLPHVMELMSIVDYGKTAPMINEIYFPGTDSSSYYWASTTCTLDYTSCRWSVRFNTGRVINWSDFNPFYVRCVRGQEYQGPILTDNGDGTVTDTSSGLMWQQGESNTMTWEPALTYCEELSLAGYSNWHLPNIKELRSIVDSTKGNPAISTTYFPNVYAYNFITSEYYYPNYWSSTTSSDLHNYALNVSFVHGQVGGGTKKVYRKNRWFILCALCPLRDNNEQSLVLFP